QEHYPQKIVHFRSLPRCRVRTCNSEAAHNPQKSNPPTGTAANPKRTRPSMMLCPSQKQLSFAVQVSMCCISGRVSPKTAPLKYFASSTYAPMNVQKPVSVIMFLYASLIQDGPCPAHNNCL